MGADASWSEPVFITGASRSGTAMVQSILVRNRQVRLAGETHYFDDLRPRVAGRPLDDAARITCADYFRSLTVRPYGKNGDPAQSWLSREELLDAAGQTGDTADSIFEAFCKLLAAREGASVWGEKTPRHVFRIKEILEAFPRAKVICMIRDPRAVVASYRDWRYQGGIVRAEGDAAFQSAIRADEERAKRSYHIVLASLMWRGAANAAFAAQTEFTRDRARIVNYETVANEPEAALREITAWLGIDFEAGMLDIPLHNSSATRFDAGAGVSKAPQNRWREALSDREIGIIQKVAGKTLTDAGYEPLEVRTGPLDLPLAWAGMPVAVVRAALANRSRTGSLPSYALKRLKAVLGA